MVIYKIKDSHLFLSLTTKVFLLRMLALCLMLSNTYYDKNYASIISLGLVGAFKFYAG